MPCLTELEYSKYKYIVNVTLANQTGAGVKMGNRCLWDTEADCYAHDSYANVRMLEVFLCH